MCSVHNNDAGDAKSSIQSGTKPWVLMEFPWKLAAARHCWLHRDQPVFFKYFRWPSCSRVCAHPLSLSLVRSSSLPLSLSLSLFLSLSVFPDNEFVAAPRSPPVKSYLVTARNMLGEAYLSVRLHLSVPVPFPRTRRREESAGSRRDDWKYTVTRCCSSPVVVIVVGFRNPSSRHRGIAPPGMALAPVAPSPTTTSGNNRRAQTDYPRDARVARCVGAHSLGITVMTKKNRGSYFSLVLRRVFLVESQGKTADRRVTIIFTFSLRLKYRLFAFDTVLIISFGYNSM